MTFNYCVMFMLTTCCNLTRQFLLILKPFYFSFLLSMKHNKNISTFCIMSGNFSQHRFFQEDFLVEGRGMSSMLCTDMLPIHISTGTVVYLVCRFPHVLAVIILFELPQFPLHSHIALACHLCGKLS